MLWLLRGLGDAQAEDEELLLLLLLRASACSAC